MTFNVTPHLNFRGNARVALDFYQAAFGGEQTLVTYGDFQQGDPDQAELIVWGQVASADGVRLMAFDILEPRHYDPGANAFFISLRGASPDETRARWNMLADGATIVQPLARSIWSALYGMLTDRFGVTWIIDVEPQ